MYLNGRKMIPLKCSYCNERWIGSTTMIGKYCVHNPNTLIGRPGDVVQCDPEDLDGSDNPDVF